MIVFIIFTQALFFLGIERKESGSEFKKDEFKISIEAKQEALRQLLQEDSVFARTASIISFLILVSIILGTIFLADFFIKRLKYSVNPIFCTLEQESPKWNLADVLRIIIIFLFFQYLIVVLFSVFNAAGNSLFFDNRSMMILGTLFMDSIVFLSILRFVIVKYKQKISVLGISFLNFLKNIVLAIYSYLAFIPVLAVSFGAVLLLAKLFNYTPPPQPIYELIFEEKRTLFIIAVSVMVPIIGPIAEETFFRGFLYGALKNKIGVKLGIIISAFLFSLLHNNLIGFAPILLFGIFLAYIREKTGSIMPSIVIHIIHNSVLAGLLFFFRYAISKVP